MAHSKNLTMMLCHCGCCCPALLLLKICCSTSTTSSIVTFSKKPSPFLHGPLSKRSDRSLHSLPILSLHCRNPVLILLHSSQSGFPDYHVSPLWQAVQWHAIAVRIRTHSLASMQGLSWSHHTCIISPISHQPVIPPLMPHIPATWF